MGKMRINARQCATHSNIKNTIGKLEKREIDSVKEGWGTMTQLPQHTGKFPVFSTEILNPYKALGLRQTGMVGLSSWQ